MPVIFDWDPKDFDKLTLSCDFSPETPYILKYMPKEEKILEAGCGSGRYVAYLSKRGFDIVGIEIGQTTVNLLNKLAPGLDVRQGDITRLSFGDGTLGGVICLGVVEHFVEGPQRPLLEILRALKPGCYAIITVPSFNYLRRIKYTLRLPLMDGACSFDPKRINAIRRIFGKKLLDKKDASRLPYKYRDKAKPETFFEYFFTKKEFEKELKQAGFKIVESAPVQLMGGIYHELSQKLAPYDLIKFKPGVIGEMINFLFSMIPFFHNHMHLCVVTK